MYKNILLCICLGFLSCCSSTEENTISVSGIYYVTSGYQTLTDSTGRNDRYDFTPEDGIFLTVSQGGKAVYSIGCLGELCGSAVDCTATYVELDDVFGVYYADYSGTFSFNNDGTAKLTTLITAQYPEIEFLGTSEINIELKLFLVKE